MGAVVAEEAGAADPHAAHKALQVLASRDLTCPACRLIGQEIDNDIRKGKVTAMSAKKVRKWLKKHFKPKRWCNSKRFPDRMGVLRNKHAKISKLVPNPIEEMRGHGWKPDELKQIVDGTHEPMKVDHGIGAHVAEACKFWLQGQLPIVAERLDGLLEDGEAVSGVLCAELLN